MKDIITVIKFTMKDMVKRKSFIISTLIILVLIVIGFNVPNIIIAIKLCLTIKLTPPVNQWVNLSKKSLNFFTNQKGLGSILFKNIAHNAGVKVKATNPEITTEITMVIANC